MHTHESDPEIRPIKGYVEAYPRLDSARTEKMFRAGHRQCQWLDAFEQYSGAVWVTFYAEDYCILEYDMAIPHASLYGSGTQRLAVVRAQTNALYRKPYFMCPRCHGNAALIILKADQWACRSCHKLGHRSQKLSAVQRAQVRYEEITKVIVRGGKQIRPKHMQQMRFVALCKEQESLKAALRGKPRPSVHADLMPLLNPHWMEAG